MTISGPQHQNHPLPTNEPFDLSTALRLLQNEIDLASSRIPTLDEPLRRPVRWFNTNIAWTLSIAFTGLMALRIATAAHLNLTTMQALLQVAAIQSLALQTVPVLLSVGLIWVVNIASTWAGDSRSVWAVPGYVVTCVFCVALAALIVPLIFFVTLVPTIIMNSIGLAIIANQNKKLWRLDATIANVKRRSKAARKKARTLDKARRLLADIEHLIDQLLTHGPNSYSQADLEFLQDSASELRSQIPQEQESLEHDIELIRALVADVRTTAPKPPHLPRGLRWVDFRTHQRSFTPIMSVLLSLLLLVVGYVVLTGSLWLPAEQYRVSHIASFSGYELSETQHDTTILRNSDRTVILVPTADIQSRRICSEPSVFWSNSFASWLLPSGSKPWYPTCRH
jgi:hypothetical protein